MAPVVALGLIGITVGATLYRLLPDALVHPQADENIWLEQPWRLAAINAVYYTPIIFAQSLILWRYVRQAWWWPTVILGSVVVVYPAAIWLFEHLGRLVVRGGLEGLGYTIWELSWVVWFFGFGGSSVYVLAQWMAMLRWTRNWGRWGLWFVTTSVGWLIVLRVLTQFGPDVSSNTASGSGLRDHLYAIVVVSLYQLAIGGVLAMLIRPATPSTADK